MRPTTHALLLHQGEVVDCTNLMPFRAKHTWSACRANPAHWKLMRTQSLTPARAQMCAAEIIISTISLALQIQSWWATAPIIVTWLLLACQQLMQTRVAKWETERCPRSVKCWWSTRHQKVGKNPITIYPSIPTLAKGTITNNYLKFILSIIWLK